MHTFKDEEGRPWVVAVNVAAIKRVRAHLNVDLFALLDGDFGGLEKLVKNPIDLVDVLYVLCMEQAEKKGVSDEEFGRGMAGDAILHATAAFTEELADFFPDPRRRAGLRKVIEKANRVTDRLIDRMDQRIDAIDEETLANELIRLSGNVPASSASTQAPSPSEN